ncbi:hypothetical protein [Maribacter sp. 2210JD10-5]|uniref:hypothetical protein n=1 Tax=Maribacter sp. 2210JD10-5 TaxID=3386272 RepID=UPI0039BC86FE
MKKALFTITAAALVLGCNIKKEEKGELPELDIDVTAEAGELPEYDVNWADINIGTTTKTVTVPKVVVVMEEEEVEVPYIDVDMPNDDGTENEERTIMVEAEVTDNEHAISIDKIYASEDKLFVVSELERMNQSIGDKKMRVSDQVVLKAPDMNVKHYVVGEKPDRVFNTQYTYVKDLNELEKKMDDYEVIYTK